jgi:hypothetical protein
MPPMPRPVASAVSAAEKRLVEEQILLRERFHRSPYFVTRESIAAAAAGLRRRRQARRSISKHHQRQSAGSTKIILPLRYADALEDARADQPTSSSSLPPLLRHQPGQQQ